MTRNLRYLLVLLFVSVAGTAFAQQPGAITGTVLDEKKEPLIGAVVRVLEGNVPKGGGVTDIDGIYLIKPLAPGRYTVEIKFSSYKTFQTTNVIVSSDKNTQLNASMELNTTELDEFVVVDYKIPLIDPYSDGRKSISSEEIEKMPVRTTDGAAATAGGVYADPVDGGLKIQGAREDGTLYIIDGIQVRGNAGKNLAQNSIDQIDVITSGLSAKYGDAIGGVVNITTKGFSDKIRGGVLLERSVDGYGHNLGNVTLSGPLYSKRIDSVTKRPIAGFFVGADFIYDEDPRPIYGGVYKVKDAKMKELQDRPLVPIATASGTPTLRYATEFVRADDLEVVKKRQDAESLTGRLNAKLDFQLSENLNLTAGGNYSYDRQSAYAGNTGYYIWSLFASDAIPTFTNQTGRGFLRLTQRFGKSNAMDTAGGRKPLISNAYYSLQADYQTTHDRTEHADHGRDLFKYNYVGKFNQEYMPTYEAGAKDDSTGLIGVIYRGDRTPTRATFERSELNPLLANYTSEYYNVYGEAVNYQQDIPSRNGLINGQLLPRTYGLWENTGYSLGGYNYSQRDQFAVSVDASFDLQPGKTRHAIEFGLMYQQRIERTFQASMNVGQSLWQMMRLRANQHIIQDKANPILIVGGNRYTADDWRNGNISFGPTDTILYNYIAVDTAESQFSKNLRQKLGVGETEFINVDAYDPNTFSLDLFSADELLNNGDQFVGYNGYDYTGKKQKGQVNFNDFFTKKDANGNYTRDIGAYRPNYIAGYILDKFQYKDMQFNIGLRVDRFDNNTKVLKDPYSLYEVRNMADGKNAARNELNGGHPSNIGDDYVIYVNTNETSQPSVVGYRNGDDWYDPYGRQIEDPKTLTQYSGGRDPQPFLVNRNTRISDSTFDPNSSFTDYTPQVNVMPRVKFSFPISDQALFYAHYDVIVQRPRTGAFARQTQYLFLEQYNSVVLSNSDLKPEKLFDYEVGFQQTVTKQSALTLSAFYKERKDMIQVRPYLFAWPKTYYTFGNRDFSTTKGLKVVYDLRRVGNLRMNLAYTLQFAEGSGSGTSSANGGSNSFVGQATVLGNFISASLPNMRFATALDYDSRHMIVANIDYRYDDGAGPAIGDVHFLENAGVNFIFSARSGEPYTRYSEPIGRTITGDLNGSRLPWHYNIDMRLDKDFKLAFGKKKEGVKPKDPLVLNAYVLVYNLMNRRDITRVNGYTGLPDDDGYLTSPNGIAFTNNQTDPQSFVDLYGISTGPNFGVGQNNPNWINLPRRVNIGLQLNF